MVIVFNKISKWIYKTSLYSFISWLIKGGGGGGGGAGLKLQVWESA